MATIDFVVKNGLVVTEEAQILSTTDAASSTDTNAAIYTAGGAAIAKKAFVGTDLAVGGATTLTGDIAVNGGDLTTSSSTFNLINATATTVNFAGAATTIEIGAASGTTNVNNNLDVDGDVNIDGGDLTVSTSTFNLANTTATTGNLFGAGTAITIGATTGTTTIRNANTVVTGDLAVNGADITTSSTGTATLFNTNATTLNIGGAATAITIGATTGTTTIRNANTVVTGDLAVNGSDITTTSTGTATLFNANATTLNIGGAATTIEIGAASGTTNVNNNLDVDGDVNIDGGDLTVSTATFNIANANATTLNIGGAATTIEIGAASGTTNINHDLDVDGDVNIDGGDLTVSTATFNIANTTATTGNLFGAGTAITIGATTGTTTIRNANTVVTGDLAVNGGDITSNQTTFNLVNATATTVNFAGAATDIQIGSSSGTTNVNNNLDVDGDVNIDGGDLTVSTATFNLANTTATTGNLFGAGTAITIGATTGTTTIRNPTITLSTATTVNVNGANPTFAGTSTGTLTFFNTNLTTATAFGAATTVNIGNATAAQTINIGNASTGASTYNFGTAPTATGNTKTVNIGTAGASGSTTNVNIGSAVAGTTTINSGTLVGAVTTQNVFNTLATTVNAFGAAGTINVGANSGTLTIGNPTVVGTQATVNLWNSTSTTVNFAGAATAVNIGAATGTTTINTPELRIGGSDTGNYISFRGTTGDQPGSFNHTYIGERIHAGTEASELLIFKGNDPAAGPGPDRVRVVTGEFRVDTYTTALSDTFENIGASATPLNRMLITANGQVTLGAGIASTTTATGTLLVTGGAGVSGAVFANTLNSTVATGTAPLTVASTTVVTNLNADLLDGFNSATASTVSTVAVRDASGDINVRLVRSEFANQATISGAMAFRVNNTTDNYIRFCSDTPAIRTFLSVPTRTGGDASGTWAINITGNAATVTNGVYTTGDQTIGGTKTFSSTISGSINGNAATANAVINTVAGTGSVELVRGNMGDNDQARILVGATATNQGFLEIATADDGSEPIHVRQYSGTFTTLTRTATLLDASGNTSFPGTVTAPTFTGALNGNAATVTNGVYTTGDQTIGGVKTFSSTIVGSINGNAATVTNGVYTSGNQTIGGVKTFSSTIVGSINGNAATVTNGVYTSGDQNITGAKVFYSTNNTLVNTVAASNRGLTVFQETASTDAYMSFHISGDYAAYFGLGGAENDLVYGGWSAGNVRHRILHSGNYTSWAPSLTGAGANGTWGINITGNAASVTNGVYTVGNQSIAGVKTFTNGTASTNTTTGSVVVTGGVGVSGNVNVGGALNAISKSFLIDHPTKSGMKLRYGSLEGPENGVYVRGKLVDSNVIELPDYWTGLVHADSITVNLTAAAAGQQLYVERVENNCVYIVNETGKPVNCFYTVYGERKDVDKLAVEIE